MGKRDVQVILRQPVQGLGKLGELVEVKPGYARNYLFPRQMAVRVTPGLLKEQAMRQEQNKARELAELQKAEGFKLSLEKIGRFEIKKTVGENDALFGTVTNDNIAEAILAASGLDIDRRNIILDQEVKKTGVYSVQVRLHTDVTASIKIQVSPE